MEVLILLVLAFVVVFAFSLLAAAFRRASRWNRAYERLGKRYGGGKGNGGVVYGFLFTRPSMRFDYGRTFVTVRNRKSLSFSSRRKTEVTMMWPDRRLKLDIMTALPRSRRRSYTGMRQVEFDDPQFQSDFYVASNQPPVAQKFLNPSVRWQLEQLRRHSNEHELCVTLNRGSLVISKPGYIKQYQQLEDLLRFSLEMFDLMMLVEAEGIDFLNAGQASIVSDVKCPICSEVITEFMVVCARCKTPHCQDCWEYNGQCATFACSEERFVQIDDASA